MSWRRRMPNLQPCKLPTRARAARPPLDAGNNQFGQLGSTTPSVSDAPWTMVQGLANATQLAAGDAHSCVVLVNGSGACWGSNM